MDDPTRYAFIERWATREDLDIHLKTDHVADFVKVVMTIKGEDEIVVKKYKSCGH